MKTTIALGAVLLAVTPAQAQTFQGTLTGAAERPNPVNTAATGKGVFTLSGTTFSWNAAIALSPVRRE